MQKKIFLTLLLPLLIIPVYAQESAESSFIPSWIKSIASAWGNDQLTDTEFTEALEFLIESEIIVLPNYQKIPPIVSELDLFDEELFDFEDLEKEYNLDILLDDMMVESEIQVKTDKTSYTTDENITISGSIQTLKEFAQSVTIVVVGPNGNIVDISQVMPESDGSFSHAIGDSKITVVGEYEVRVQYGSLKITSNFDFE